MAVPLTAVTGGGVPPRWSRSDSGVGGRDVEPFGEFAGGDRAGRLRLVVEGGHAGAHEELLGRDGLNVPRRGGGQGKASGE